MLRITVEDIDEGTTETVEIPKGEFFLVTADPCWLSYSNFYKNGETVQLTIKGRIPR
jgi:hypothetical protein